MPKKHSNRYQPRHPMSTLITSPRQLGLFSEVPNNDNITHTANGLKKSKSIIANSPINIYSSYKILSIISRTASDVSREFDSDSVLPASIRSANSLNS